jgi:2-C-methyl-D-erythritol 4-phosphate cytidylyltransferase
MSKTIACVVIETAKTFSWLGHMPIVTWALTQMTEVRGVDRVVCVVTPALAERTRKLVSALGVEVVALPKALVDAPDGVLEKWLTSAAGPAFDAAVVVLSRPTSPFLPAGKIEACVSQVRRQKVAVCQPARPAVVVTAGRKTTTRQTVESVKVFRVAVPKEQVTVGTVPVSLLESLDVRDPDEYILADAVVAAQKI